MATLPNKYNINNIYDNCSSNLEKFVKLLLLLSGYFDDMFEMKKRINYYKDGKERYFLPDFVSEKHKKIIEVNGFSSHCPTHVFPNPNFIIKYGSLPLSAAAKKLYKKSGLYNYVKVGDIRAKDQFKYDTYKELGYDVLIIEEDEIVPFFLNGNVIKLFGSLNLSPILEVLEEEEENLKQLTDKITNFIEGKNTPAPKNIFNIGWVAASILVFLTTMYLIN